MLLVTNRPSVYVLIKGVTVELEVDVPTEVSNFQGKKLIKRGICMVVVDTDPVVEVVEGKTGEVMGEVSEIIDPEPVKKPVKKK